MKSNLDRSLITTIKNTAPNVVASEVLFSHSKCPGQTGLQQGSHIINCLILYGVSGSFPSMSILVWLTVCQTERQRIVVGRHSLTQVTHLDNNLHGLQKTHFSIQSVVLLCPALSSIKKERYNLFNFDD